MFRGVFIGIDRYAAPVNRLACAAADAQALGTLFEDTLGGEVELLLDDVATAEQIRQSLIGLQTAAEEDVVVISFSGHGTEQHQLVPVDVDVTDLPGSCISLAEVATLLDQIPSRSLIVVLDCCFSGGFGGARVFAPTGTRSMLEDRTAVEALSRGEGRVVICASGPGEPAFETSDFGHGLLTQHLLEALQGAEGLATNERISLLSLYDFVMRKVQDSAEKIHEVQTPSLYGSIDGAPTLARLVPGARFAAAFPHLVRSPATSNWASLLPYGLSQDVLDQWSAQMPGLNELQLKAVNDHGVLDGKSLLVVAPTGAGKTMIGELAALQAVGQRSGSVMLLPLRALVNDKYLAMTETYGDKLKVIRATGEHSDQVQDLITGQYDIALLTYEKFLSLSLGSPHLMRGISTVIVDEVQILADRTRGANLEFLLTMLRSGLGRVEPIQVVALSAVIGETLGMERWLGGSLLRTEERPVPLRERVVDRSGSIRTKEPDGDETNESGAIAPEFFHGGSEDTKPYLIPLIRALVNDGKKVIVFRATKPETVGAAGYLAQTLHLPPAQAVLDALPGADLSAASQRLRDVVAAGVAFHNADLDRDERAALEAAFRDRSSPLRVLVATTTLAMGINTPAEAVIVVGLIHPGNPSQAYTIAEYKNMAGRAGRPGITDAGEAYIFATSSPAPQVAWETYVQGVPEDLESRLLQASSDPLTLILHALLALGGSVPRNELLELLENSFAMWLQRESGVHSGWDPQSLEVDLQELLSGQLIDQEPDGSLTLTALGRYAGESGIEVRSVTRVASLLRYAPAQLNAAALVVLAQVTLELDQVNLRTHDKARSEQQRWPQTLVRLGAPASLLNGLHVGGGRPTLRAKRAAACLMLMTRSSFADIERELLQHTPERSAAGPIRSVAARTRDVIGVVANICSFYGKSLPADDAIDDLGLQLEIGLPQDSLEVARTLGTALTRGDYLTLLNLGLMTWPTIQAADPDLLQSRFGQPKALLIKSTADAFVASERAQDERS